MSGNLPTARTDPRVGPRTGRVSALALAVLLAACGGGDAEPPSRAAQTTEVVEAAAASPDAAPPARREEPTPPPPPAPTDPVIYDAVVVAEHPHDEGAFTQGLFVADGVLYESTGKRGASRLRRLDLATGTATAEARLPDAVFGEGSTVVGDRVVVLSWRAGQGFVHDLETLEREATFPLAGEGWGIAYDQEADRLIVSDGTSTLRFLDPATFAQTGATRVTLNGRPLPRLNELEWIPADGGDDGSVGVGGRLLANVWQQDFVVRIDPDTGVVDGVIDVSRLFPVERRRDPVDDVPNGIAYDAKTGRLYMTGKRWPALFEVTLRERATDAAGGR